MSTATLCRAMPDCQAARRITAICRSAEAARVGEILRARVTSRDRADLLWLTWVQWRALGRERMMRETGLSLWTITCRLRQIRDAGIPVPSWSRETDLLARGRFDQPWDC